jgi:hypothetical protein
MGRRHPTPNATGKLAAPARGYDTPYLGDGPFPEQFLAFALPLA